MTEVHKKIRPTRFQFYCFNHETSSNFTTFYVFHSFICLFFSLSLFTVILPIRNGFPMKNNLPVLSRYSSMWILTLYLLFSFYQRSFSFVDPFTVYVPSILEPDKLLILHLLLPTADHSSLSYHPLLHPLHLFTVDQLISEHLVPFHKLHVKITVPLGKLRITVPWRRQTKKKILVIPTTYFFV